MAKQRNELSEKQWQAISLLKSGMARKDVAKECGWKIDYFKKLCSGDISTCGYTADLFKKELLKVVAEQAEDTKALVEENTLTVQRMIKFELGELEKKQADKKSLSLEEQKLICTLTNSISNCKPTVSVGSIAYSYTQGLTPEELLHEFTRLTSIAESSFNRRPVQEPE